MFPSTIRLQLIGLFLVLLICYVHGQDRKVIALFHPNCKSCTIETNLLYIRAEGPKDTLHQIWDFTQGLPTVIFAVGRVNSTMTIEWLGTVPQNFVFDEPPKYIFGFVLDKLIEYNDLKDIGRLDSLVPQRRFSLENLKWELSNSSSLTEQQVIMEVQARKFRGGPGVITVKLTYLPYKDYAVNLPHLIHTANNTLIDVSIENVTTSSDYNASRYAWHATLASTDAPVDTMKCFMRKSLDDEHTPGIFEILECESPATISGGDGGFLQFRPVGYTQRGRGVASSTIAHASQLNYTKLPFPSTMNNLFRTLKRDKLVEDMFISFGEAGDGFYRQHNYLSWSLSMGWGSPPVEQFSLLVALVLGIGLGVPVLLAISGLAVVLTRRCRQARANQHARFTDDLRN